MTSNSGVDPNLVSKLTNQIRDTLGSIDVIPGTADEGIFPLESPSEYESVPFLPANTNSNGNCQSNINDITNNLSNTSIQEKNSSISDNINFNNEFQGATPPQTFNNDYKRRPVLHCKLAQERTSNRPHRSVSSTSSSTSNVLQKLGADDLKSVKSHTELAETANGVRMLAKNLAKATIQLDVRNIMIVTKARDNSLIYLTREVAEWLLCRNGREIVVHVDGNLEKSKRFNSQGLIDTIPRAKTCLKFWNRKTALRNPENFDLVVTLGGDGTVLYVSNLFQRVVPPVISFSLGSLGFLTNFKFEQFREKMSSAIDMGVRAYLRMRFTCRVHKANGTLVCEQQVLNELVVDRGPSPYVTNLELYGDGSLLTVAQADGLIIATPTGSTAYSLSAGGSLVHPGVSAISVTPICPHTLSFRPILLPDVMLLRVKVPESSRSTAWASFDGKVRTELSKGDYVTIQASPYPFPTVISSKTEYIDSVSRNLNWNVREQQKPFASLLKEGEMIDDGNEDYDINTNEDIDDEIAQDLEEEAFTSYNSSSDEDPCFLPDLGKGLNTPPSDALHMDERTCFAHPNARIHLA